MYWGVFVVGIALILFNRLEWEKAPDPVRAECSPHLFFVSSSGERGGFVEAPPSGGRRPDPVRGLGGRAPSPSQARWSTAVQPGGALLLVRISHGG